MGQKYFYRVLFQKWQYLPEAEELHPAWIKVGIFIDLC